LHPHVKHARLDSNQRPLPSQSSALPLSYEREEPPAGVEPAPRPYKGRVLAVDTTEALMEWTVWDSNPRSASSLPVVIHRHSEAATPTSQLSGPGLRLSVETAGVEPAPPRCKRVALPSELRPQVVQRSGDDRPVPDTRRAPAAGRIPARATDGS